MTGRRWQSYATPKMPPAMARRWRDQYERDAERNAAAVYQLSLRDAHDEGQHIEPIVECDFCKRASATGAGTPLPAPAPLEPTAPTDAGRRSGSEPATVPVVPMSAHPTSTAADEPGHPAVSSSAAAAAGPLGEQWRIGRRT